MQTNSTPTIVIGAGLAGLAASLSLARSGQRVLLLEAGAATGSAGGVAPDSLIVWNERCFFMFLGAAALSGLLLLLRRPKDRQAANVEPSQSAQ